MEINVNKVEDSFYRYKMPKLLAKVEGKGNGIKTVIVNMSDIAKSIYRKPSYPTKYFGFELGAQVSFDDKRDRYVVNGLHDASKLQEMMFGFIKKFVLCHSCDNPETSLYVKKPNLQYRCRACGHCNLIDPTHRLTAFIMKNPPENEQEGAYINSKDEQKSDDYDFESSPMKIIDENLDLNNLNLNETLNETKSNAIIFKEYIEDLYSIGSITKERSNIADKARSLDIGSKFILVLMEVIFCNRDTILEDVVRYKNLFLYFTRRGEEDEIMQDLVMVGMEKLMEALNLLPKSCHFLKTLYDNDIVEEDAIFKWHNEKDTDSYGIEIRKECQKMVEWLQEAEEESDSD